MSVLEQARRLAAAGHAAEARALIEASAARGDPDGLYGLASWRLYGMHGPRDLDTAHRLLDRACVQAHVQSLHLKATLLANGTGCTSDPEAAAALLASIRRRDRYAALQLELAQALPEPEAFSALPQQTLSTRPLVFCVPGAVPVAICDYIMTVAEPNLQPSFVQDPRSGQRIPHPVRTSHGMSFGPTAEDLAIHRLNRGLAALSGTRVECGEPLHILCYAPGQEYRPHSDALPNEPNQRDWTVLLYLNDDYVGGATRFVETGLEFRGRKGDALVFRNVDDEGRPEPLSRHAGLPVERGVKWLATRWIRRARYHPWDVATFSG